MHCPLISFVFFQTFGKFTIQDTDTCNKTERPVSEIVFMLMK